MAAVSWKGMPESRSEKEREGNVRSQSVATVFLIQH